MHCDPTASHYLKLLMDDIFGKDNFQNEIVWSYKRWPAKQDRFQRMHDIIFWYTKNLDKPRTWNQLYDELADSTKKAWGTKQQVADFSEGHRKPSQTEKESPGAPMKDVWNIGVIAPKAKERTGYPTQKPIKLLERIIKASSNHGDMVLDPFCGCATTCVVAEKLDRQWIGIDISEKAAELVKVRIKEEIGILLFNPIHRFDVPTDRDGKRSKNIKHTLYGMQEGKCTGCLHYFPFQNFTVDHIVPKSKGGADTDDNLQLLCGYCNSVKGNRTQEYLISQVRKTA